MIFQTNVPKTQKTILVVEDEEPLLLVIEKKLEASGFVVLKAKSVLQAISYLKEYKNVDAIWLDHYLFGDEDGLTFISQIKNPKSLWKKIPVFVISNTASKDKVKSYLRLGIDGYYTKADNSLDKIVNDIKNYIKNPK